MEFGEVQKRKPTPLEMQVIDYYASDDSRSSFDVALELDLDIGFVHQTTNWWLMGKFEYNHKAYQKNKETTMAGKDKNKKERDEILAKLREGGSEYGVEMDKVRGLLGELEGGEALICQRQATTQKVILRLGDVSYI
jgi:hypothetical protein